MMNEQFNLALDIQSASFCSESAKDKPLCKKPDKGQSGIRTVHQTTVTDQCSIQPMENRSKQGRSLNVNKITAVKDDGREPWQTIPLIGNKEYQKFERMCLKAKYEFEQKKMAEFNTDDDCLNESKVLRHIEWLCVGNLKKELDKQFSFSDVVKDSLIAPVIGKKMAEGRGGREYLNIQGTLSSGKSIWALRDELMPEIEGSTAEEFDKRFAQLTLDYFKNENGEFNIPRIQEYIKNQSYLDVKNLISDVPVICFNSGIIYGVIGPLYGELKAISLTEKLESKLRKGEGVYEDVASFRPRQIEQAQQAYDIKIEQIVTQIKNKLSYETFVDQQKKTDCTLGKKTTGRNSSQDQEWLDIEKVLSSGKSIWVLRDELRSEVEGSMAEEFDKRFSQLTLDYFKNENGEFNIPRIQEYIKKQSYLDVKNLISDDPVICFNRGIIYGVIGSLYGELKAISLTEKLESKLRKGEGVSEDVASFRPRQIEQAQQAYDIKIEQIVAEIKHKLFYETFVGQQKKRAVLTADCSTKSECMARKTDAQELFNQLEKWSQQGVGVDLQLVSRSSVSVVRRFFRNSGNNYSDFPVNTALMVTANDGLCMYQLPINEVQLDEGEPVTYAAQSPLPEAQNDFWQSIIRKNSPVIVDLTRKCELQEGKANAYYPEWIRGEETKYFPPVDVTLCTDTRGDDSEENDIRVCKYVVRTVLTGDKLPMSNTITRLHFHGWDDQQGVDPEKLNKLIDLVDEIAGEASITVHCSDGVGRTGTFITARTARHMLERGQLSDDRIKQVLENLIQTGRRQRNRHFVNTGDQVHTLLEFCRRLAIPAAKNSGAGSH